MKPQNIEQTTVRKGALVHQHASLGFAGRLTTGEEPESLQGVLGIRTGHTVQPCAVWRRAVCLGDLLHGRGLRGQWLLFSRDSGQQMDGLWGPKGLDFTKLLNVTTKEISTEEK